MSKAAYKVIRDSPGCYKCGSKRTWTVLGPDGLCSSTSYEEREEASWLASNLNKAFELGRKDRGLPR